MYADPALSATKPRKANTSLNHQQWQKSRLIKKNKIPGDKN